MIDLGTIAGLHELHAYCGTCDRWSVLPLAQMVAAGMGEAAATAVGALSMV